MELEFIKKNLDVLSTIVGLLIFTILLATVPSLLIWNHIISPKFGLPLVSLWEMACIILFIRIITPTKFKA